MPVHELLELVTSSGPNDTESKEDAEGNKREFETSLLASALFFLFFALLAMLLRLLMVKVRSE